MHTKLITPAQLAHLKREAKAARKQDPTQTYNQHLNALAIARYSVRNYHELQGRLNTSSEVPVLQESAPSSAHSIEEESGRETKWKSFQRMVEMSRDEVRAADALMASVSANYVQSKRLEAHIPIADLVPAGMSIDDEARTSEWLSYLLGQEWILERIDGERRITVRTALVQQWQLMNDGKQVRVSVSPSLFALYCSGDAA